MKEKLIYYKNLDGLRGIAAISVLVFHFFSFEITNYVESDIYKKITELGQHGVSLFFVLSGFVITRILINNKNDSNYFSSFYKRRALRIFPLYYGFLIFWFFVMPFILEGTNVDIIPISNQIPTYLYLQNFQWLTGLTQSGVPGHYWSLAVEEHFYLVWPLIVYILPTRFLQSTIIIIIILTIPLKYFLLEKGVIINKITPARFDQILLGALLAFFEFKRYFAENKVLIKKILFFSLCLVAILVLLILGLKSIYPNIKELLKYNILGLLFFAFIGFLILYNNKHLINDFLTSNMMQYLGKISYGIYVWHIFVLKFITKFMNTKIIMIDLILSIIITIVISHVSYNYFEKLFLKFK